MREKVLERIAQLRADRLTDMAKLEGFYAGAIRECEYCLSLLTREQELSFSENPIPGSFNEKEVKESDAKPDDPRLHHPGQATAPR